MRALLAGLLASASACVSYPSYVGSARPFAPEKLAREPGWLAVRDVPVVRQESEAECGAAAIAMVVTYWTSEPSARLLGQLRPVRKPGLEAGRLRDFARRRDLAAYLVSARVADLERELAAGRPVLVGLVKPQLRGALTHYEVVVGFHRQKGLVVTLDPAEGWRQNDLRGFLAEWKPAANLALVVVGHEERSGACNEMLHPLALRRSSAVHNVIAPWRSDTSTCASRPSPTTLRSIPTLM